MAALAAPLRELPALKTLSLSGCKIGDEGVASLVDNLGKDDFKALERLELDETNLTDKTCTTLAAALNEGAMPKLTHLYEISTVDDAAADTLAQAAARRGIVLTDPDATEEFSEADDAE